MFFQKKTTIKGFEYSPLGKELKAQTDITKKQYQGLDKVYDFDKQKMIKDQVSIVNYI